MRHQIVELYAKVCTVDSYVQITNSPIEIDLMSYAVTINNGCVCNIFEGEALQHFIKASNGGHA